MPAIVIGKIEDLVAYGYLLRANCHACRHHSLLDLIDLGDRLGFEHSTLAVHLTPRLRCGECGGKDIGLILSPRGETQTGYSSRY